VTAKLVRALFQIGKLTQGFEVALAVCSPLAYVAIRAFAALCHWARRVRSPRVS